MPVVAVSAWVVSLIIKVVDMMQRYNLISFLLLTLILPVSAGAQTQTWCGDPPRRLAQGSAWDYTKPEHQLRVRSIERVHFTDDVRALRRGSTGYLIQDIEFMLNSIPNHYQALDALARLAVREGTEQPRMANMSVECRFHWARQVNSRDAMVPLIHGLYFFRQGNHDEARQHFELAASLDSNNPEVQYNLGLVLFRLGDYTAARNHARRAYSLGYPLPGLRNLLAEAGYPL